MERNLASRRWSRLAHLGRLAGLTLAMLFICLPGAWIVISAMRPTVEIMAKPPVWIPHELSFQAFISMFGVVGQGGVPVFA